MGRPPLGDKARGLLGALRPAYWQVGRGGCCNPAQTDALCPALTFACIWW